MSNTKLAVPPEFDAAPKNQRIAFVQELWDRIVDDIYGCHSIVLFAGGSNGSAFSRAKRAIMMRMASRRAICLRP